MSPLSLLRLSFTVVTLLQYGTTKSQAFSSPTQTSHPQQSDTLQKATIQQPPTTPSPPAVSPSRNNNARRSLLLSLSTVSLAAFIPTNTALAKCTDLESCREIGERRDAELAAANPVTKLGEGLQYKVLAKGLGDTVVTEQSKVQITYSISQANGSYMYSKGFGFNKIDVGNGRIVSDLGIDTLLVDLSNGNEKKIPVGIQKAIVGMKRGEKRRIQCPPALGFETSDWNPQPTTFRGRQQIKDYRNTLYGRGDFQPAFPAPTIWDVEVVSIR